MNDKVVPNAFHAKDGLHFLRTQSGSVLVLLDNHVPAVELDADTWASVVASVSAFGDVAPAYERALDLHHGRE